MKHIFIVETPDDVTLPAHKIEPIADVIERIVESHTDGRAAYCRPVCNVRSAIRAIYGLYSMDTTKSPDELGSAK